jgi:hypothetical protein
MGRRPGRIASPKLETVLHKSALPLSAGFTHGESPVRQPSRGFNSVTGRWCHRSASPRRYTPPPPRCTMLRASIRAFAKRSGSKRASVRLYQKDHRATAAPSDNHDSTLETHLLGDPRPRRLSLRRDRWSARFKGGARCVLGGPRPRGRIVSGSVPDACDHRARPHLPMCGRLSVLHAMRRLV